MLIVGGGLLAVALFALWMMDVTGIIPHTWFVTRDEDPGRFQKKWDLYVDMAAAGAVLTVAGVVWRLLFSGS